MKQTTLCINSRDRSSGTDGSYFKWILPYAIKNVKYVEIVNIELPFSWYPVNDNNNVIVFKNNAGTTFTKTLTNGSYDSDSFCDHLQDTLNSGFTGFTVSYSDSNGKLTIANGTQNFQIMNTGTCDDLIGIVNSSSNAASWTSDKLINLSGTNHVFICSQKLSENRPISIVSPTQNRSVFMRVPVDENFGSILRYKSDDLNNRIDYGSNMTLTEIDFTLLDENLISLDLNGMNWNIELLVTSLQD